MGCSPSSPHTHPCRGTEGRQRFPPSYQDALLSSSVWMCFSIVHCQITSGLALPDHTHTPVPNAHRLSSEANIPFLHRTCASLCELCETQVLICVCSTLASFCSPFYMCGGEWYHRGPSRKVRGMVLPLLLGTACYPRFFSFTVGLCGNE